MLVTNHGGLRMAPLVAVTWRELAPGASTDAHHYAGLDVVCVGLGGVLSYEPIGAPSVALQPETVALVSTGAGVSYRWRSIGDEPALVVMLWLRGRSDVAPRIDVHVANRFDRLCKLMPIAGPATPLPTPVDVEVVAGVLPVGRSLVHMTRGRHCYVISTIGAIAIDGNDSAAGTGVLIDRRGALCISARQSTELVIIDTQ